MKRLLYIIIPLLLTACSKDLELDYRTLDPIPVIEANLTDDGLHMRMTLTTPMNEPMDTAVISDYVASLSEPEPGLFRLNVDYRDQHFFSECAMQPAAHIAAVKFNWIQMPYDHVAVMTILLLDNPDTSDDAWWIRVWRNGKNYQWMYYNDKYAVNNLVEASSMVSRQNPDPDDEDNLADGDTLRISVTHIPPHILTYLEKLSAHTIAGPTTFSGDFCLGYFLAATPSDTTLIFHPDEF